MIKNIFFVFLVSISVVSRGQITFQKTYGGTDTDIGYSVKQTNDGYVVVGNTLSFGAGSYDMYIIRTNINGDTIWTKTFGGTYSEMAASVSYTNDDGIVFAGSAIAGAGQTDAYLNKIDSNGNIMWEKTFGGTNSENINSLLQTSTGEFVLAGYTNGYGIGKDVYLIKADINGNMLWTRSYNQGACYSRGNAIQGTSDGGFIVTGITDKCAANSGSVYLLKVDQTGGHLWSKKFYITGKEEGIDVLQLSDGGYIVTGVINSSPGNQNSFLIRTDNAGDTVWVKQLPGLYYIEPTFDGGFILCGKSNLVKMDLTGNISWAKTIDSSYLNSVNQTNDGGFIVTGFISGGLHGHVCLIKTDSDGNSGCNDSSINIIVTALTVSVTIPATQTSSGGIMGNTALQTGSGGIVTTLCSTVGLNNIQNQTTEIKIMPNPFSDVTTLHSDKYFKNAKLIIYNSFGQQVKQIKNITGLTYILHRDNLPSGLYFIRLTQGNSTISTVRLILTDN